MVSERQHRSLLHTLQLLYSRVVARVLHTRVGTYRKPAGKHRQDVATPLSEDIERLAASERARPRVMPPPTAWRKSAQNGRHRAPGSARPGPRITLINRTVSGLTRYFKIKPSRVEPDPQMSEKLKKSTWNHIHTALRLARQGEVRTARLHADIANQALHEAGHYMSEQEFKEFSLQVQDKLSEIRKQDS